MRKILATILIVMSVSTAYALPLSNPIEANLYTNSLWCENCECCDICDPCFKLCEAWSLRFGYYGNYVFNRHLTSKVSDPQMSSNIKQSKIYTNAGYLALNFCDRIDIFATLGTTSISLHGAFGNFAPAVGPEDILVLHFATDFSWSIGARTTLWECGCFGIGIEGEYFRVCPSVNCADIGSHLEKARRGSTDYAEWQVGLGASYLIALHCPPTALVPYIGVMYSEAKLDGFDFLLSPISQVSGEVATLQNQKVWSWAIGTTLILCDVVGVTIEGRFAAEKALYLNGQLRF